MSKFRISSIALAIIIAFIPPCIAGPDANAEKSQAPAKPFKSMLGALRVSRTPVVLPSWLPEKCNTKPLGIGEGPYPDGYEYWFGTASADTNLFGSAGVGRAKKSQKHIQLNGGRDACLVKYHNVRCLEWQQGRFVYRMGVPDNPINDPDLIKAANSVVLVPPAMLNAAPKGDDPLAQAYARVKDTDDESKRAETGAKYDQGIEAASRGDYKKAESLYRQVIAHWKQCYEMPPLSQVQMALAQTLSKSGRAEEADQIKKDFADKAVADEQVLTTKIEEQKAKIAKLAKDDVNYSSGRGYIGTYRWKLANLLMAEGKYDDAESMFKAAFQDVATVSGRNAFDAKSIAEAYAGLLRTMGKSDEPAKKLVQ